MGNTFKITLFNINDVFPACGTFKEPSLGLGYIKSYFDQYASRRDKIEIQILKNSIWDNLIKKEPDIIGISSVTQDYTNAIKYARKIKQAGSQAIIIIGGIHISNLPESFNDAFDVGVIGEGEETFKELIETIYESGFNKEKLRSIKGLLYKTGSDLINTGRRDLIEELDRIPQPYRKYLKLGTFLHILTARGCPYRCSYCSSTAFWGYKVRFHSAQRLVEEMKSLIGDYRLDHISIWDDLFTINKKRLHETRDLMQKSSNIFRRVTFGITTRPNVIDEELCVLLKEMNVKRVSLGIESGSDKMLATFNRGLTKEDNYRAIHLLKKYGFVVNGGFVIGAPQETKEDLEETVRFAQSLELDGGNISFAVPYPNTAFWNYAKDKKYVSDDMDFSNLVIIQDLAKVKPGDDFLLLTDCMSRAEFLKLALKLQKFLEKKNVLSLFNRKTFNLRNIIIFCRHPLTFLPFLSETFKKVARIIFRDE